MMENERKNKTMDEIKLVKYLSGELNDVENKEVELWLESPENKTEFEKVIQLWDATANLKDSELFHADKNWNSLKELMKTHDKKGNRERNLIIIKYAVAASFLVILGLASFFYFQGNKAGKLIQHIAANSKLEKPVTLPDGTIVHLNRNTSLTYSKDFNGKERIVTLIGEAFFDVTKNPSKPFIIKTATTEIKVVGTSFNVMAYNQSDSVLVSVQTGIVEMYPKSDKSSKIRLAVGSEGTFVKSNKKLASTRSFDSNIMAWRTNQLKFRDANMEYVSKALSHTFGKEFQFESGNFKNCRLTANFNNQSLDVILKVIQETFGVKCSNRGDVYILSGPGC
jgi:ferric-dicitrate binding protein FerR (iron transport regulator)